VAGVGTVKLKEGAYRGGDDNDIVVVVAVVVSNIAWRSLVPDSRAKSGMCGGDVRKVGW